MGSYLFITRALWTYIPLTKTKKAAEEPVYVTSYIFYIIYLQSIEWG